MNKVPCFFYPCTCTTEYFRLAIHLFFQTEKYSWHQGRGKKWHTQKIKKTSSWYKSHLVQAVKQSGTTSDLTSSGSHEQIRPLPQSEKSDYETWAWMAPAQAVSWTYPVVSGSRLKENSNTESLNSENCDNINPEY